MAGKTNTFYQNGNDSIPAHISVLEVTPSDTTVRVTPKVNGGTTHYITYGKHPSVKYPNAVGDIVEDTQFSEYWLDKGRQSYNNRNLNSKSLLNNILDLYYKHIESHKSGGTVKCAKCGDKIGKKKLVKKHQIGGAFGSLLTGPGLGLLAALTNANSDPVQPNHDRLIRSLIPDDAAIAEKRKVPALTIQNILDFSKSLMQKDLNKTIRDYIPSSFLIENKKKNETTRGSKTGTDKTRK